MIKISGSKEKYLTVTLTDILDCMPIGNSMNWSILNLQATWDSNKYGSVLEFERRINESDVGLLVSWSSLVDLGKSFDQVIEILLIGDDEKDNLKRYIKDINMFNKCSTVIELVDSDYWLVKTDILEMEDNLIQKLNGEIYSY